VFSSTLNLQFFFTFRHKISYPTKLDVNFGFCILKCLVDVWIAVKTFSFLLRYTTVIVHCILREKEWAVWLEIKYGGSAMY
jgi:hypothetical protein